MFSPDMPRTLSTLAMTLLLATACVTTPPPQVEESVAVEVPDFPTVQQWLQLKQEVQDMSSEQVVERLVEVNRPEGAGQLYYYGLLNQQLDTYGAWTQARDAFQELEQKPDLASDQRQLVDMLRRYNQLRINAYLKQRDLATENASLQQQLLATEEEKSLLEQKIQALTDLEAVISTRKEE